MTWIYLTIRNLWSKLSSIIIKEDDARLYLPCLDHMYRTVYDDDDDDKNVRYWWTNF